MDNFGQKTLLCRVVFPALRYIYAQAFVKLYGADTEKWTYIGRKEFGDYVYEPEGIDLSGAEMILTSDKLFGAERHDKTLPAGIFFSYQGDYFLVFRGTIALQEWVMDFNFIPVKFKKGSEEVHRGFYRVYQSVKPAVAGLKEKLSDHKGRLYICGHSLGGTAAVFSALELAEFHPNLITFACPKTGNKAFASRVDEQIKSYRRYELKGDPLPELPPGKIPLTDFEFAHAGKPVKLQLPDEKKRVKAVKDRLLVHLPSTYIKAVQCGED